MQPHKIFWCYFKSNLKKNCLYPLYLDYFNW